MISQEVLQRCLPKKYKVNQELLDNISSVLSEPELFDTYRENFIGYMDILNDGKYKIKDYISAVKYCTHKLMGHSNIDSFIKTFPDRYQAMLNKGYPVKDINSYVTVYNKSKLVTKILEQAMIPTWILNQDLYQKAINVQADLMMNAQSEKVRSDSANSILIHLKPPEVRKVELDIGVKKNDDIEQLRLITAELASQQRRLIQSGVSNVKDTLETKLVIEHKEI